MLGACPQSSSVRSHPIPIPRTWCPYLVPVPTSRVQSRTWCLSPPVEFSPVPRVLGACPHQSSSVRSRVLAAPWCLSPVDRSVPRTWCLSPPVEFSPVPRACCSFVLGACPQSSSVRSHPVLGACPQSSSHGLTVSPLECWCAVLRAGVLAGRGGVGVSGMERRREQWFRGQGVLSRDGS
jgi:hypothetical protein